MKKLLLGLVLLSQISLSAAQTPISWHKKIAQTNEKEKYEVLIASDKSTSTELADTLQHQQIIGMNFDEVIQKYWEEILRKHMIQEINNFRQKNGVAGHLKENNQLNIAARKHARFISDNDYVHTVPSGEWYRHINNKTRENPYDRAKKQWYNWSTVGEVVAKNMNPKECTIQDIIDNWDWSPKHKKILLHPQLEEIGFAQYQWYCVADIGRQTQLYDEFLFDTK